MKFQDFVDIYFPDKLTKTQIFYCESLLKKKAEGKTVVVWPRLVGRTQMVEVLREYLKKHDSA